MPLAKAPVALRYGENPHQSAALYLPVQPGVRGIAQAAQVQGKALSYNNYNDADAALELVAEFRDAAPTVVIVKHANPCGVATRGHAARRVRGGVRVRHGLGVRRDHRGQPPARRGDGGGDRGHLHRGRRRARCADDVAQARCSPRKKNLRLLLTGELPDPARGGHAMKTIAGGMLVQTRDAGRLAAADLKLVTRRAPTEGELADCLFAWVVAKHVKSNAIVYAKGRHRRRGSARAR